jgi:hypothetical protein
MIILQIESRAAVSLAAIEKYIIVVEKAFLVLDNGRDLAILLAFTNLGKLCRLIVVEV